MPAYNVVRFRTKPGQEQAFIDAHKKAKLATKGVRKIVVIKTGERDFCVIGEWDKFDNIVAARSEMISVLNSFRDTLEDLGGGLGVTDPVSGSVVATLRSPAPKRSKAKSKPKPKRAVRRKRRK
jgi:hypothetical protein